MLKFRHADKFKFYSISTYLKGEERGLFLHAEDEKHYVVGHMYLNSDTTGRRRRFIRAFLVDQKGKATHYREYFESADVPSFEKLSTVKKVPLCDPEINCALPVPRCRSARLPGNLGLWEQIPEVQGSMTTAFWTRAVCSLKPHRLCPLHLRPCTAMSRHPCGLRYACFQPPQGERRSQLASKR
ncbi:MAG: hypothetical protein IPH60_08735 [Flavobacteriales bacterium]|nr:hypothetical protein [Flavobacteriales bacterium]